MALRPTHEHEFEAQRGLPAPLPAGERILWQGSPVARVLARRVFHIDLVAIYFAVLLAWRVAEVLADGGSAAEALSGATWIAFGAALGLGLLALLASFTARTTVYTLTDRRVVMRIGIVLTAAYNLPLVRIESAAVHDAGRGCGDIALKLPRGTRIAFLHLWPHVRPWQLRQPQPMLRGLPDAAAVATLLGTAWAAANGLQPQTAQTPADSTATAQTPPMRHVLAGH